MARYTANGTTLSYYDTKEAEYKELKLLMEVPEFGGTPEKIDVTTLSDNVKKYVPGIKDYGDLVFKFMYDNAEGNSYDILKSYETAYETAADKDAAVPLFKLTYPDNTAHIFKAIPALKMDAGSVNGALSFSCTMIVQGEIELA